MIQKLLVALSTMVLTLLVAGRAEAETYRTITDEEMKAMVTRILAVGAADSEKEEMKGLLDMARRVRPLVELVDAKCPMPLKVANGTSLPLFNVEVKVSERRGREGLRVPQVVHIPYIPPKSTISGTVACAIPTTGYRAYGERDIFMSASPIAEHSRLDDEGIKKIVRTNMDVIVDATGFSSASSGATAGRLAVLEAALGRDAGAAAFNPKLPSILAAILNALSQENEPLELKFVVGSLLRTDEGAAGLGKWLRTAFTGHAIITPILATAAPAKVRVLVEELLKAPTGGTAATTLAAAAVLRVCGPGQPESERTSMWLAALGKDVVSEDTRETVLDKCGVGKEQTRARLKAAKPEQLGRALDGMTGDLFNVAVAAMTETKSFGAALTLLSTTQNDDKFLAVSKAAASFVTVPQNELILRSVAGGTGVLDEVKAKWISAQLDDLHKASLDVPVLKLLLGDMAKGLVPSAAMRKVVYPRWQDAGKDALDPFMAALASRSHPLAPAWIRAQAEAGKLDLVELLEKVGGAPSPPPSADDAADDIADDTSVTSSRTAPAPKAKTPSNTCQVDSKAALACLSAVHSLPLTKDAIDPSFADAAVAFLKQSPREDTSARLATQLSELGVDMSGAVDALCEAAPREPGRWGYGSGHEDTLNTASTLSASHPCIASVRLARASAERWIAAGIGLRLTLALVPFGFVGLFAKRRFVPVRAQLAKESAELELVRGKAAISLRLARPQTEEALGAGVTDAARFLTGDKHDEVAVGGRALQALASERRAALLTETRRLAQRAAETGSAATLLAELDGIVLYIACFPGREDQPQAVRRHPGFTDGWPAHMERIIAACVADGRPSKVLSLVFMLGATGDKTTLLVGYDTPSFHFVPDSLSAGGPEATHDHRYELSLGEG